MASEIQNKTDEELMVEYQKGSEEAFKKLFDKHQSKVYGFLLKKSGNAAMAADLTQETFLKIHRSKHLYDSNYPVLPWFFSVTRSVLIDSQRKNGKEKSVHGFDFDKIPIELESPQRSLEAANLLLAEIPEKQKMAIELRYVEEKTFEEIARALNTSQVNVRQLISRGISNLKSLVKKGDHS